MGYRADKIGRGVVSPRDMGKRASSRRFYGTLSMMTLSSEFLEFELEIYDDDFIYFFKVVAWHKARLG